MTEDMTTTRSYFRHTFPLAIAEVLQPTVFRTERIIVRRNYKLRLPRKNFVSKLTIHLKNPVDL